MENFFFRLIDCLEDPGSENTAFAIDRLKKKFCNPHHQHWRHFQLRGLSTDAKAFNANAYHGKV